MRNIVEELRLLQSGAAWVDIETAAILEEAAEKIERMEDALNKIGGITMSMCLNYKDMAETQRGIAIAALKETECE
jgi:hypothetical protein